MPWLDSFDAYASWRCWTVPLCGASEDAISMYKFEDIRTLLQHLYPLARAFESLSEMS